MQVPDFNPIMKIPYYYPCNLPLIHESLKRQGSISSLSLLANARLYGLPAYSSAGIMKWYFSKLSYADSIWRVTDYTELPGFENGLDEIRKRVGEGKLFLATGTSYYLPYCDDYLNPKYIEKLTDKSSRLYLVDHWLAVSGIKDDHVLVYDPVPSQYAGPLSLKAFHDFWKGNKNMPELADAKRKEALHTYGSFDVEGEPLATPTSYKEALLRTLATHAYEFLTGSEIREGERIYYFGHAVTLQLLKKLHLAVSDEVAEAQFSSFLFDMRWCRYFFRDFLHEIGQTVGAVYIAFDDEFAEIVGQWEHAHKLLKLYEAKKKPRMERIGMLGDFIANLSGKEQRFYERIWSEVKGAGLFDKRSGPIGKKTEPRKDALVRIVLDSCREINRYHEGQIPVELGLRAPLYGRNGNLDSLGLVSLLTVVEHGIQEELGIGLILTDEQFAALPDSPFRTVESFVGFILDRMPEAV